VATPRRTAVLILVLAAAALGAGACRRVIRQGGTRGAVRGSDGGTGAVRDEIGRTITPRALPTRRVVSLAPNVTELLFAIGAEEQLVGIDRYSDEPAGRVERLPQVGTNYEPSLERIVALAPDVVFLSKSANRRETADALERMGVPAFITDTPGLADVDRTVRNIGMLTGHAREADAELARLEAGFAGLRARTKDLPRPRIVVAVWTDPLFVAGQGTFIHDLVEVAGGENVTREVSGYAKFPIERLLHLAPDVIILPTHAPETKAASSIAAWDRWPSLPAVRGHRVFAVEDSIITRPGPRLVAGAERLARLLHPELAAP
jgi:iron complex transport system substrate-binding protein